MSKLHIYTSAACNYIPKVRMLFRSLREHHPEAVLHLALADATTEQLDLAREPFDEVASVAELGIPQWQGWAFCHSIVELATAIKPFYLRRLLAREDCAQVLYLDPDMVVFSRLDDILQTLQNADLALTPHQLQPDTDIEAVMDNEICSLMHGVYNLGFIGVRKGEQGRRFAQWWADRVYHFCRADIRHGLFTDQRWIDLVPAFFPGTAILRSPRHNVATWNLTTRRMTVGEDGRYLVDGEPLGFYHFTGFDSGAHQVMANKNGADSPAVQKLIRWYLDSTRALAADPLSQVPWAYGRYDNGQPIEPVHRVLYRERVDLQLAYPNPFAVPDDADSYFDWLRDAGSREYRELFNPATREMALLKFNDILTPGFRGLDASGRPRLAKRLKAASRSPSQALALLARAFQVWRREGYRGVMRRLMR